MSIRRLSSSEEDPVDRIPPGSQILRRGAEAVLYHGRWHDLYVVVKRRVTKSYRILNLDLKIRRFRTIHESNLLHEAKLAGVRTPLIYSVDLDSTSIIMEYISGDRLKDVLDSFKSSELNELSMRIGVLIGRLHRAGIVHGDLTTSNMILIPKGEICLLDFGLGEHSTGLEARGVDLHILRTILYSTHYTIAENSFQRILTGYREEMGREEAGPVVGRMDEISRRGRYVSAR